MAIPGPGTAISLSTLNTEFGGGYALSSYYRGGTYVPNSPQNTAIPVSGTIALGNFYSSSNRMSIALTASGNNYDVYANRGPTYQPGKSDLTVTVPGTIGSGTTGAYAMLVPNAFSPTDTVTIVNNGVIQGAAGPGSAGAPSGVPTSPASSGGNALYVNRPTTIINNGTVAGGGGGGGGGGGAQTPSPIGASFRAGGGGGGGGAGQAAGTGGAGGGVTGVPGPRAFVGAPGAPGNSSVGGGGGGGGNATPAIGGTGGAGGGRGAAGASGAAAPSGTTKTAAGGGGGAGNYIVGNAFVTWPVVGTRQGGAS